MDVLLKRYKQKYNKVRDDMSRWDQCHCRLLSQFGNAVSIIERLPMLMDSRNYGELKCVDGINDALVGKQMVALQRIFSSMKETMAEFLDIVLSLGKIVRDSQQQLKSGSLSPSKQQIQLRIGISPSIAMCVDGLKAIYDMHQAEYLLKSSLISALSWESSSNDIIALRQLLTDQPNIPKDEVQLIFNIIFPEDVC